MLLFEFDFLFIFLKRWSNFKINVNIQNREKTEVKCFLLRFSRFMSEDGLEPSSHSLVSVLLIFNDLTEGINTAQSFCPWV